MVSDALSRHRRKPRPLIRARSEQPVQRAARPPQHGDLDARVHCGWGRLIFAQTFAETGSLVGLLQNEAPDERDIAVYVDDPHVVLAQAPQDLFLDPSHMLRLPLAVYRPRRDKPKGFSLRRMYNRADALANNAIYARLNMVQLPLDCHILFTISEEVGSGASAVLHGDVAELVAVDNGTQAEGQNSSEFGVTIGMADQTGPFDYHLTRMLLDLARDHGIGHQRDVFRYYRCDAASAVDAGNDIRTALLTFGIDASHGYERIHMDALVSLAKLLSVYVQSPACVPRDALVLGPLEGFTEQPQG